MDHIIPVAEGGTDSLDNLQALCPNCHSDKTEMDRQVNREEELAKETHRSDPYVWDDTLPANFGTSESKKIGTISRPTTDFSQNSENDQNETTDMDVDGLQENGDSQEPLKSFPANGSKTKTTTTTTTTANDTTTTPSISPCNTPSSVSKFPTSTTPTTFSTNTTSTPTTPSTNLTPKATSTSSTSTSSTTSTPTTTFTPKHNTTPTKSSPTTDPPTPTSKSKLRYPLTL